MAPAWWEAVLISSFVFMVSLLPAGIFVPLRVPAVAAAAAGAAAALDFALVPGAEKVSDLISEIATSWTAPLVSNLITVSLPPLNLPSRESPF